MVRQYETTFIIDAHLSSEQIEEMIQKYSNLITANTGRILSVDRWGKRRLAYEIKKKQYGYYVWVRFEADGEVVAPLEKEFKLDEQILRYIVLRVPKALLKTEDLEQKTERDESESDSDKESAPKKSKADEPDEVEESEEGDDSEDEESEDVS